MRYFILFTLTTISLFPSTAEACGMYFERAMLVDNGSSPKTLDKENSVAVVEEEKTDAKPAATSVNLRKAFAEIDAIDSSPESLTTGEKQKSHP